MTDLKERKNENECINERGGGGKHTLEHMTMYKMQWMYVDISNRRASVLNRKSGLCLCVVTFYAIHSHTYINIYVHICITCCSIPYNHFFLNHNKLYPCATCVSESNDNRLFNFHFVFHPSITHDCIKYTFFCKLLLLLKKITF